jgi:hypothetical protein
MAVVFGFAVWAWSRPSVKAAHTEGAEVVYAADTAGVGEGGTRDEAAARFRGNVSRHWRQVTMGTIGNGP